MTDQSSSWSLRIQQIETLSKSWKQVNLRAQLQGPIESDAARVSVEREHLTSSRKHLMQITKEYSKIEDQNEKLSKLGPLIKAYQVHVDESNKCIKSVESARSSLYEFVKQMEDPVPVLEKFIRACQTESFGQNNNNENQQQQESTNIKNQNSSQQQDKDKLIATLEEKIQDLVEEMSELKNQEVTIAQLREQVSEMELDAAHEKQQAANEMSNEVQEVLKSWQQREFSLRQENTGLVNENRKLQKLYNDISLQFSGAKQQLEHSLSQREKDAERNADEVQELQVQLAVAKRENQILNENVASLKEKISEFEELNEHDDGFSPIRNGNNNREGSVGGSSSNFAFSPFFNNNNGTTPQGQIQQNNNSSPRQDGEVANSERKIILELSEKLSQIEKEKDEESQKSMETISKLGQNLKELREWGNDVNLQYERLKDAYDVSKQENHTLRRKLDESVEEARELRRQVIDLEGNISELQQQNQKQKNVSSPSAENEDQQQQHTIITIDPSSTKSSSSSTLEAVVAQRDNLKRRLLNLEDASSRELNLLRQEVNGMKAERQGLLVEIAKLSGNLPATGGSSTNNNNANVKNNPSSANPNSTSSNVPPNPLDLFGNLIAKFINTNATTRRILVIYLLSLHLFFFLMLALDT